MLTLVLSLKRFAWPVLGCILAACTSARSPESGLPATLDIPPIASGPPQPTSREAVEDASVDAEHATGCAGGFVEVFDRGNTIRYALGRELVPGVRGANHAFIERLEFPNGTVNLHLEALAKADGHGGHLSLAIVDFHEPRSFPAVFDSGHAMYMGPLLEHERDERHLDRPHVEITSWGPIGSWIEGTFGPPTTPRPLPTQTPHVPGGPASGARAPAPPPRAPASGSSSPRPAPPPTIPYSGRFRVCRTSDWHSRL